MIDSFEKYISPTNNKRGRKKSPIWDLGVGEICYLPQKYNRSLYSLVRRIEKGTGHIFSWMECENGGVVIKRDK